jgi:hypothetical protein
MGLIMNYKEHLAEGMKNPGFKFVIITSQVGQNPQNKNIAHCRRYHLTRKSDTTMIP